MSTDFGIRRIGIAAAVLAIMASAPPQQAQAQTLTLTPSPAFLLIGDGRATDAGGPLSACSETTHRLAQQLKQQGMTVYEVLNPTSVDLRVALTSFSRHLDGKRPVIAYCGYAAVQDGRIFLSSDGPGDGQRSNLLSQAVPAVSLLRVLDGHDGFVFLELHPQGGQSQPLSQMVPSLKSRMPETGTLSVTMADMVSADPVMDGLVSVMQPGWQWASVTTFAHGNAPKPVFMPVQAPPLSSPMPTVSPAAKTAPTEPAEEQMPSKAEAPPKIVPVPDSPVAPDAGKSQSAPVASASGKDAPKAAPAVVQKPVDRIKAAAAQKQAQKRAQAQAAQAKAMRSVQVGLLAHGVYAGSVNGMRTGETVNAIRKFQKSRNEPATGQLTPAQLSALTGAGN